ncbi:hypothetical protein V8G54_029779 [Vigna mungo]|uniref:Uncharacterized protein n=1 Tax=Vigna mungo TaxID=3915 RepID=A0AAQ3MVA5_VIGMU
MKLALMFNNLKPGFPTTASATSLAPDHVIEFVLKSTSINWRPTSSALLIKATPSSFSSFSDKLILARNCFDDIQAATEVAPFAVMSFPAKSKISSDGADSLRALARDSAPSSSKFK